MALRTFALVSLLWCLSSVSAQARGNPTYDDRHTGMRVTITRAMADRHGDLVFHPKRGHFFLWIHVVLHDGGRHIVQSFGTADFEAVTQSGDQLNGFIVNSNLQQLEMTKYRPGMTRAGWVGWDVPPRTKTVTITWNDGNALDPPVNLVTYRI